VQGSGTTLSGRAARGAASLPTGAQPAQAPSAAAQQQRQGSAQPDVKPSVPFSGSGNTLSGKKPVETIEVD